MKIAVLGGSFNPVHIGHLALADAVHKNLGYDRVILVPANIPPHKDMSGGADRNDRLEMLKLATSGADFLAVDDCELSRGGVSYTIDTLKFLADKHAALLDGRIALVIGEDLVAGFHSWRDVPGLLSLADIVVARRPGESAGSFPFPHRELENDLLSISSSGIRSSIAQGKSWRYLVPDPVYRYIVRHTLYEYRSN